MSFSEEYEEIDIADFQMTPMVTSNQTPKHQKFLSETISTSNCTFENDRQQSINKCILKPPKPQPKSRIFDLPDRLTSLKQITDNKIKFMKVEKELKEQEECTFKPKTNPKDAKSSYKIFSRPALDYNKPRNSVLVKLKLQNLSKTSTSKTPKPKDSKVHDRLYKQAKQLSRPSSRC